MKFVIILIILIVGRVERVFCFKEIVGFKDIGVYSKFLINFIKLCNYYSIPHNLDIDDDENNSNKKMYFVSTTFRATWMNAQSFCRSYGMDLATLESEHEANYFFKQCENNYRILGDSTHIGGVLMTDDWFWITSHKKVNFKLKFKDHQDSSNVKNCLQIVKENKHYFAFGRTNCFSGEVQKFVCQKFMKKQTSYWNEIFGR